MPDSRPFVLRPRRPTKPNTLRTDDRERRFRTGPDHPPLILREHQQHAAHRLGADVSPVPGAVSDLNLRAARVHRVRDVEGRPGVAREPVPFLREEGHAGLHFTGITRCNWNNATVGAPTSAPVAGARLQQTIVVDHLIVEDGPNSAINGGNVWIGQLEALGGIGVIGQDLARVGNLRLSDLNNTTVEWNERRPYRGLVAPIVVNATTDFEIPVTEYCGRCVSLPRR